MRSSPQTRRAPPPPVLPTKTLNNNVVSNSTALSVHDAPTAACTSLPGRRVSRNNAVTTSPAPASTPRASWQTTATSALVFLES